MTRTVLVAIVGLILTSTAWAESLAEVAKREKERRAKAGASSGKVIKAEDLEKAAAKRAAEGDVTNSDAPQPQPSPTPGAPSPSLIGSSRGSGSGSADPDAAKRARAEGLKSQLAQAEGAVRAAEENLKRAEEHSSFVNSHTNQDVPLSEARMRREAAKRDLERAREQRDAVEDTARKAGIPPGWIR